MLLPVRISMQKPNLKAICQQVEKKDHKVALKQLFAVGDAAAPGAGGGANIFGAGAASGGVFGAPAPAASGSDPFGGGGGDPFGGSSASGDPFGGGGGGAFGF